MPPPLFRCSFLSRPAGYEEGFRDVEELLAKRGIMVSYETNRQWGREFGPDCAPKLKRRHGRFADERIVNWGSASLAGIADVPRTPIIKRIGSPGDYLFLWVGGICVRGAVGVKKGR